MTKTTTDVGKTKRKLVSVIVPTRNEEAHLPKCLSSIAGQDYGGTLEVLIVDGMSNDGSRQIIKEFTDRYPTFRLLENAARVVPAALNIGIQNSTGEVIVRVDAHCWLEPDYVSKCVEYLENKDAWNVGGLMRPEASGYVGKAIAFAHNSRFGLGGGKFHFLEKEEYVDTVYLGAFRRRVFEKVGFFDERLVRNQDIELNRRIGKAGGKILLTPEIKSHYSCRSTLIGLWRQNFANGMWNVITTRLAPGALSARHFVPLVFVTSLVTSSVLALFWIGGTILLAAILGSYLALSTIFSFKVALKDGLKFLFVMPVVFLALHLSYGLGSFWGILKELTGFAEVQRVN